MAVPTYAIELKLVGAEDRLEVDLLSLQGLWTEQQYFKITDQTNRQIAIGRLHLN